jgi:hypothetical protein
MPEAEENLPAEHALQRDNDDSPGIEEYVPAGHNKQLDTTVAPDAVE